MRTLSRRSCFALAGAAGLALLAAPMAGLAPEPDPVARRWELKVELGPMRVTTLPVQMAGGTENRSFFYTTYRVTNRSGNDVLFAPSFELAFGNGKPIRSGRDVPSDVTKTLLTKMQNPFLQDQIAIIGQLLQGEENARDGIVIWSAESLAPEKLTMYAAGFSGETATVILPDSKTKTVLRKSLMVRYDTGGDMGGRGDKPLGAAEQRWIMR